MWHPAILEEFRELPPNLTTKYEFYGPYSDLLNRECFTKDIFMTTLQYEIPQAPQAPQAQAQAADRLGEVQARARARAPANPRICIADFAVTARMGDYDSPVLVLQVSPPLIQGDKGMSKRAAADRQMRKRLELLRALCRTPRLYGISAMGEKLCIYCMQTASGKTSPKKLPPSTHRMNDPAPDDRWDMDVTTQEGYDKFMAIISDIERMTGA